MKKDLLIGALFVLGLVGLASAGRPDGRNWWGHASIFPATQTLSAGKNTIAADACGGVKRITATSAVTTDTTNTFDTPTTEQAGCVMVVVNAGTFVITLDANANFATPASADQLLGTKDSITVVAMGTYWQKLGSADNATFQ